MMMLHIQQFHEYLFENSLYYKNKIIFALVSLQSFTHSAPPFKNYRKLTRNTPQMQADKIEHRYRVFEQVLGQECAQLACHFSRIGFSPGLVVTEWWLTLYARQFSPDLVGRLWDCFLLEVLLVCGGAVFVCGCCASCVYGCLVCVLWALFVCGCVWCALFVCGSFVYCICVRLLRVCVVATLHVCVGALRVCVVLCVCVGAVCVSCTACVCRCFVCVWSLRLMYVWVLYVCVLCFVCVQELYVCHVLHVCVGASCVCGRCASCVCGWFICVWVLCFCAGNVCA